LIYDHKTNQSRCFGFVEFENEFSVNLVLSIKSHLIDENEVECKPVFLKNELDEIGPIEGRKKRYPKRKAHGKGCGKNFEVAPPKMTLSAEDKERSEKLRPSKRNLNLPMKAEMINQRTTPRNAMSVDKGQFVSMAPQFQFEDLPKQFDPNFNVGSALPNYGGYVGGNGGYAQPVHYPVTQNQNFPPNGQYCQQGYGSQVPSYGPMMNSRYPAGYSNLNSPPYMPYNGVRPSKRMSIGSLPNVPLPLPKPLKEKKLRLASSEGPAFHQFLQNGPRVPQYSNPNVQNFHPQTQNPQTGFMTMPTSPQNSLTQHPMGFNFYHQPNLTNIHRMSYPEQKPEFSLYGNTSPPGMTEIPQSEEIPQTQTHPESDVNTQYTNSVAENLWRDGYAAGQLSQFIQSQQQTPSDLCYPTTIPENHNEFPDYPSPPQPLPSYPFTPAQYMHDMFCNCGHCQSAHSTVKDLNNDVYFTDNMSTTVDSTTQKLYGKSASNRSSKEQGDEQITEFNSDKISKDYHHEKSLDVIFGGTEYPIFTNI
jgi:hypothetical protein